MPTKYSKLMKYGNAHFHNCAVIGPQNRHKNKRNLSRERVQGVTNLKNHISETYQEFPMSQVRNERSRKTELVPRHRV